MNAAAEDPVYAAEQALEELESLGSVMVKVAASFLSNVTGDDKCTALQRAHSQSLYGWLSQASNEIAQQLHTLRKSTNVLSEVLSNPDKEDERLTLYRNLLKDGERRMGHSIGGCNCRPDCWGCQVQRALAEEGE